MCLCCGNKLENHICRHCSLPFLRQYYIGIRDGLLKDLVYLLKYDSVRGCAKVIGDLFYETFGRFLIDNVLVPLPTIAKHVRERGFDHTKLLAKWLTRRCGGRYEVILGRRNNAVQVGADAETRKKQAENAYFVQCRLNPNLQYVLIDDIWTTGSSILAACGEMQKAGAMNISVVIVAKSR